MARRLIVWLWVHHLGGKLIEVARELRAHTSGVSRWYAHGMSTAGEMEELASPFLLPLRHPGGRVTSKTQRVRYQVVLDN